mmetsp:Transcript_16372/g.34599  ORF Transcript_16372/g.34599 Transcript_16372/m.34599 type:complete len:105 (+) Transcript_16372:2715-3029(+)
MPLTSVLSPVFSSFNEVSLKMVRNGPINERRPARRRNVGTRSLIVTFVLKSLDGYCPGSYYSIKNNILWHNIGGWWCGRPAASGQRLCFRFKLVTFLGAMDRYR